MPLRPKTSPADRVFSAIANPTRRDVLDLLLDGPRAVGDIAEHFDMARPSVSEHLKVLREAGLVSETRHGRQRLVRIEPEPLTELHDWLTPYERFWRGRLRAMRELLDEQHPPEGSS
jgi:DNA-binding transcriptional ArsR family regulator